MSLGTLIWDGELISLRSPRIIKLMAKKGKNKKNLEEKFRFCNVTI